MTTLCIGFGLGSESDFFKPYSIFWNSKILLHTTYANFLKSLFQNRFSNKIMKWWKYGPCCTVCTGCVQISLSSWKAIVIIEWIEWIELGLIYLNILTLWIDKSLTPQPIKIELGYRGRVILLGIIKKIGLYSIN